MMNIRITGEDYGLILESLKYSKRNFEESHDASYEIRRANLERVENAVKNLKSHELEVEDSGVRLESGFLEFDYDGTDVFEFEVSEITSMSELAEWVSELSVKHWITPEAISKMVTICVELLGSGKPK